MLERKPWSLKKIGEVIAGGLIAATSLAEPSQSREIPFPTNKLRPPSFQPLNSKEIGRGLIKEFIKSKEKELELLLTKKNQILRLYNEYLKKINMRATQNEENSLDFLVKKYNNNPEISRDVFINNVRENHKYLRTIIDLNLNYIFEDGYDIYLKKYVSSKKLELKDAEGFLECKEAVQKLSGLIKNEPNLFKAIVAYNKILLLEEAGKHKNVWKTRV